MTKPAVRIYNVSKCHHIYERPEDRLKQIIVPRLQRLLKKPIAKYHKDFWALRDISIDIYPGETVGIIGRNGAGKSTLLQVLCGTLCPTGGDVDTNGRIAALLELGSGFNSEFTGRENVHLNAAVLGLSQAEILQRFDAIAEFADIGDFIDQPVKTYSSGMLVRLAFAVIAHVDADILVIDEALAVGDAVFTQKCMRFLRKFKERGTLIFVSHDTHSVISLCDKAMWLDHGKVKMIGEAKEVSEAYMQDNFQEMYGSTAKLESQGAYNSPVKDSNSESGDEIALHPNELPRITLFDNLEESAGWSTGGARIQSVSLVRIEDKASGVFRGGDSVRLTVTASIFKEIESPIIGFVVKDRLGQWLFGENTFEYPGVPPVVYPGDTLTGTFEFNLPLLLTGTYSMTASIAEGTPAQNIQHHWIHDAVIFNAISPKPWLGLMGITYKSVALLREGNREAKSPQVATS